MRLGTITGAREALAGQLTYIGDGWSRVAYVDYETDTVYKIENDEGQDFDTNKREWEAFQTHRREYELPSHIRLVPMRLIHADGIPVIAARYINGQSMGDCYCVDEVLDGHDTNCLPPEVTATLEDLGYDTSWGNIIFDGTVYWLVDLA